MVIVKLIALPLQRIEKRFNTEYFAASSRFPTKHQLSKASIKKNNLFINHNLILVYEHLRVRSELPH